MASNEIVSTLRARSGKRLRITFSDEIVQTVMVGPIDDEGFLHSGPDCADPLAFWTRFEDVKTLEALPESLGQ